MTIEQGGKVPDWSSDVDKYIDDRAERERELAEEEEKAKANVKVGNVCPVCAKGTVIIKGWNIKCDTCGYLFDED